MKNLFKYAILLSALVFSTNAYADVKVKIRQTMGGQQYENTTYIKGKRQRAEQNMGGMQMVNITQCDMKRSLQLMPTTKTYMINSWEQVAPTTTTTSAPGMKAKIEKGGLITVTSTVKDTGERKQMFGYTARHLIITTETVASPDSCSFQKKSKMQTDGWYIDATFALDCDNQSQASAANNRASGGCQDRYDYKQIGTGKRGYPVSEKMTMFDENGKETYSFTNEVVELTNATLDASLFDAPADYKEVKNANELYASMDTPAANQSSAPNSNSNATNQTVKNLADKPMIEPVVGPKKAGVIRFGLVNPTIGAAPEGANSTELAAAIQNTLGEKLQNQSVEVVTLDSKTPEELDSEAKTKECDYMIYAAISLKKNGGSFGMFKKIAPVIANVAPIAGMVAGPIGMIAGQAVSSAITASAASGKVKSKDEITLDLKVQAPAASTVALTKQFKAKAKADGEDIITPMAEQAAQAIVAVVKQ